MTDFLEKAYPKLASRLRKTSIASLPTPVSSHALSTRSGTHRVLIKHDELTNTLYGGNKIRKLEYLLQRAVERGADRIATFGTVGSNHALATAVHATELGFACTCFLAHQARTPSIPRTLNMHLQLGTELVRFGGRTNRLRLFRRYLQNRGTWVIPLGGSSWLGAVGFVNAGLELAAQIESGECDAPSRIYIANGTMGSVAGLAVGLALAGIDAEIHAVRVADNRFTRLEVLDRLMSKTATLLNRYDPAIPIESATWTRIVWRSDFFSGGYAVSDGLTTSAIDVAKRTMDVQLDTTYTGKAMAALLHDLEHEGGDDRRPYLFWNTYSAKATKIDPARNRVQSGLPQQFERYYD